MSAMYLMRPMQQDDIPEVLQIDRASFSTPWSARTYHFEINNRATSHLVVLEHQPNNGLEVRSLLGIMQRLRGTKAASQITGYGGCWLIAGEAHISTIAVHPDFRGRSLGELLLASMLQRAIHLEAHYSVLEVRESNTIAQALYQKYEYEVVGRRRGYYRDDGEDALLMEVRPLNEAYQHRLEQRMAALGQHVHYIDRFTTTQQ
jgi:ribosomal-protein-alanine N-acetyltransferase